MLVFKDFYQNTKIFIFIPQKLHYSNYLLRNSNETLLVMLDSIVFGDTKYTLIECKKIYNPVVFSMASVYLSPVILTPSDAKVSCVKSSELN